MTFKASVSIRYDGDTNGELMKEVRRQSNSQGMDEAIARVLAQPKGEMTSFEVKAATIEELHAKIDLVGRAATGSS